MDYESFKNCIQQELQKRYPVAKVVINKINKNNGLELDCLVINENDESVIPCIYLNQYYSQYRQGKILSVIAEEISKAYQSEKTRKCLVDDSSVVQSFSEFKRIKDQIGIYKCII